MGSMQKSFHNFKIFICLLNQALLNGGYTELIPVIWGESQRIHSTYSMLQHATVIILNSSYQGGYLLSYPQFTSMRFYNIVIFTKGVFEETTYLYRQFLQDPQLVNCKNK